MNTNHSLSSSCGVAESEGHIYNDKLIMGTADDAVKAKHATVEAGYYKDPFISAVHRNPSSRPVQVIIKRGTFARVTCVQLAIEKFLSLASKDKESNKGAQILVLGAGLDTCFFRLLQKSFFKELGGGREIKWVEVDHSEIIQQKSKIIENSDSLFSANVRKCDSGNSSIPMYELRSMDDSAQNQWNASCHLVEYDLRNSMETLINQLSTDIGIDSTAPTMIVLECVQMYIPEVSNINLLKKITENFSCCHLCSYEPILGADSFGKMMEDNLTKAGITSRDSMLVRCRTLNQYLGNYKKAGFTVATGCDMYSAYETLIPAKDRLNANRCEFLDELEEFMLIMRHYCFVLACNTNSSNIGEKLCSVGKSSTMGFAERRCETL